MNWLNNEITKLVIRTSLKTSGGFIVARGWMTNDEQTQLIGAVTVLAGIVHHLWSERADIAAWIQTTVKQPAAKLVLISTIPLAILTGCAGFQTINNTSGTGLHVKTAVPIPFSGGVSILGVELTAGQWKNGTLIQPVSTNKVYSADVAITQYTRGSVTAAANAGVSTNGNAMTTGASVDLNEVTTGNASVSNTNSTLVSGH